LIAFAFFCSVFLSQGLTMSPQSGFKLMILLPQSPKCWNYKCAHHA
jgi:hypothetical protein